MKSKEPLFRKGCIVLVLLLTCIVSARAQSPSLFSFQAVIRNSTDQLVKNSTVGMRISILQGSESGTPVYEETHLPVTNSNGLVSVVVGDGTTTDDFSAIDWSSGPYFIKTETDPTGGTSYTITGVSQLLSVPFALYAANGVKANPFEVFVKAGATGGDGSQAKPFGTIQQGITAVSASGTVHILSGTYPVTAQIAVNKAGITLKGYGGAVVLLQAAIVPFLVTGSGVTIDGLTITSDNPYAVEFIQIAGTDHRILNNHIYGPTQAGPSSGWVVNRGLFAQGTATSLIVKNNIFHSLRQPAYFNASSSGYIINNVVNNTRGFVVDQALFVFSGNSWAGVANAVDIALLVGTVTGPPYDPLTDLSESNSNASISDQR